MNLVKIKPELLNIKNKNKNIILITRSFPNGVTA